MVSYALIHTTPAIKDPKELFTIISTSLRSMFGECQSHSIGLTVLSSRQRQATFDKKMIRDTNHDGNNNEDVYEAVIVCQTDSLPFIRAALTFVSPPSYLSDTFYRIDFIEVVDDIKPKWAEN